MELGSVLRCYPGGAASKRVSMRTETNLRSGVRLRDLWRYPGTVQFFEFSCGSPNDNLPVSPLSSRLVVVQSSF
jgi:hypothetical protein